MSPPSKLNGDVRILIVEDQGMMRAFFERVVAEMPRFTLAGSARSGEDALALLETAQPDVALVDFQLPWMDGLEFIRAARQVRPQLQSLVITSLVDPLVLTRVRESSVEGYIEKDATPELLVQALETVASGRAFYSEVFRETLAREDAKAQGLAKILSRREQQVLGHVLRGKTSKEIAELMSLSSRTVEFHRANLMAKLDAGSLADLIATVRKRGWMRALLPVGVSAPGESSEERQLNH
jgi:DNA-binding NarL/FixJ family response regulator